MFGAAAMRLSSVCVVSNALRLNFCRLYDTRRDHKGKPPAASGSTQTRTLHIKGMMCGNCENHVHTALEGIPGVSVLQVSHTAGTAQVLLDGTVANDTLKQAVKQAGYKVTAIESQEV